MEQVIYFRNYYVWYFIEGFIFSSWSLPIRATLFCTIEPYSIFFNVRNDARAYFVLVTCNGIGINLWSNVRIEALSFFLFRRIKLRDRCYYYFLWPCGIFTGIRMVPFSCLYFVCLWFQCQFRRDLLQICFFGKNVDFCSFYELLCCSRSFALSLF